MQKPLSLLRRQLQQPLPVSRVTRHQMLVVRQHRRNERETVAALLPSLIKLRLRVPLKPTVLDPKMTDHPDLFLVRIPITVQIPLDHRKQPRISVRVRRHPQRRTNTRFGSASTPQKQHVLLRKLVRFVYPNRIKLSAQIPLNVPLVLQRVQTHLRPTRKPVLTRRVVVLRSKLTVNRLRTVNQPTGLTQLRKTTPPQTPSEVPVPGRTLTMPQHVQNQSVTLPSTSRTSEQTPVRAATQQLPLRVTHVKRHKIPACIPVLRARNRTGLSICPRQELYQPSLGHRVHCRVR